VPRSNTYTMQTPSCMRMLRPPGIPQSRDLGSLCTRTQRNHTFTLYRPTKNRQRNTSSSAQTRPRPLRRNPPNPTEKLQKTGATRQTDLSLPAIRKELTAPLWRPANHLNIFGTTGYFGSSTTIGN
jgi:hypothetical protein